MPYLPGRSCASLAVVRAPQHARAAPQMTHHAKYVSWEAMTSVALQGWEYQ